MTARSAIAPFYDLMKAVLDIIPTAEFAEDNDGQVVISTGLVAVVEDGVLITKPVPEPALYDIVRFFQDDSPSQVLLEGVTLEEAKSHCNNPASRGDGWFDGFRKA